MSIEEKVARLLIAQKKTLSIAESCSGGLLSHRLTNIPGSSHFLKLALVVYSNDAKIKFLRIPFQMFKQYGAVSESAARQMAQNVRKFLHTDFGIAITGIAGPAGGTLTKPVGLTFIAVGTKKETVCQKCVFKGHRLSIKSQAATQALKLLFEMVNGQR